MSDRTTLEIAIGFSIDARKLTNYLLDMTHPEGASKAKFFLGHGFRTNDPDALAYALLAHVENPRTRSPTRYGLRIVFEGPIFTPNRAEPCIRSVWQHAPLEAVARFVTAYPL